MKTLLLLLLLSYSAFSQTQTQLESHRFKVGSSIVSHCYFGEATIDAGIGILKINISNIVTILIVDKGVYIQYLIRKEGIYDIQFPSSTKPLIIFTDNQGNKLYWQI